MFVKAYYERGRVHLESNDFEEAIADFDKVISLDPQHSTAYFSRAQAKEELDDLEGAEKDYKKADALTRRKLNIR